MCHMLGEPDLILNALVSNPVVKTLESTNQVNKLKFRSQDKLSFHNLLVIIQKLNWITLMCDRQTDGLTDNGEEAPLCQPVYSGNTKNGKIE